MSIALYDRDFIEDPINSGYNILLMKLATYYKSKRELVSLITDLSRAKYYTKVFYRQDNPELSFPPEIYIYDNMDIGGYALNELYIPLPKEIEECTPDTSIYNNEWNRHPKLYLKDYEHHLFLENGTHILLSLNGTDILKLELFVDGKSNTIFIYDREPDKIKDFYSYIVKEEKRVPAKNNKRPLVFKYPIYTDNFEFLILILDLLLSDRSEPIYFTREISLSELKEYFNHTTVRNFLKIFFLIKNESGGMKERLFIKTLKKSLYAKSKDLSFNFIYIDTTEHDYAVLYSWLSRWAAYNKNKTKLLKRKKPFDEYVKLTFIKDNESRRIYESIMSSLEIKRISLIAPEVVSENGGVIPI